AVGRGGAFQELALPVHGRQERRPILQAATADLLRQLEAGHPEKALLVRAPDAAVLEADAAIITARAGAPAVVAPGRGLEEPGIPLRAQEARELTRPGAQVVRPD